MEHRRPPHEPADRNCDDPAIRCQWTKGPGNMTTVKILVDPLLVPSGNLKSAVHVQLLKPTAEPLTIPVTCTIH